MSTESLAGLVVPDTKKEETTLPPPVADPVMFHGLLGEIVRATEPTTEADPVGVLASLLAGVGAAIGPAPHVMVGNTRHPLLIWPLLFGRTGSGRKGEATDTAGLFLRSCDPRAAEFTVTGLSSGEGLIERIRDERDEDDKGGTHDKRLLVIEPEFSSVLARTKREGSTLSATLRQAWDGRALSVLNRAALHASASHVAIIGHVTPREFRRRLSEADMSGGSYNRFLPVFVERSKRLPIPEGVADEVREALAARLTTAVRDARMVDRMRLDDQARALWAGRLYDEFTAADDEDAAWSEFARRAAPYCLRVAGLYAALRGSRLIHADDLTAAAALVRYAVASARFVLDTQSRNPRLDRIRRAVDGAGDEGLTRSAVSALFSRNITKNELDELLTELVGDGTRYAVTEVRTGGRPAVRYRQVLSSYAPSGDDHPGREDDHPADHEGAPVRVAAGKLPGFAAPQVRTLHRVPLDDDPEIDAILAETSLTATEAAS